MLFLIKQLHLLFNILFIVLIYFKYKNITNKKSQCKPSSLEINSLENVNPGIKPLFLTTNCAEIPEKIYSTAANAINY